MYKMILHFFDLIVNLFCYLFPSASKTDQNYVFQIYAKRQESVH